jgi:hypothetical protein
LLGTINHPAKNGLSVQYTIVYFSHPSSEPAMLLPEFILRIESHLNDGWELHGDLHLEISPSVCSIYRELVKVEAAPSVLQTATPAMIAPEAPTELEPAPGAVKPRRKTGGTHAVSSE